MQLETGKSNFRKSETINKQSWVTKLQQSNTVTTLRNIVTPKHGMNHAALMRKDWTAKATKVSAITAKNCPKLSTKTWTYSKDKKRLILKDNKEK